MCRSATAPLLFTNLGLLAPKIGPVSERLTIDSGDMDRRGGDRSGQRVRPLYDWCGPDGAGYAAWPAPNARPDALEYWGIPLLSAT
jgi:hypothetical protein